jgi:hypothetical protein
MRDAFHAAGPDFETLGTGRNADWEPIQSSPFVIAMMWRSFIPHRRGDRGRASCGTQSTTAYTCPTMKGRAASAVFPPYAFAGL